MTYIPDKKIQQQVAVNTAVVANSAKVSYPAADSTKVGFISITAPVNLNTLKADTLLNNTHRSIVTGNPHNVTKTDIGLANVTNIDTTNASNITTGTLPNSVLPPLAITTVQTASTQAGMLALTTQQGDVVVRTDLNKSFIRNAGTTGTISDFNELLTPTNAVLSVNGSTGVVNLTTTNINEGTGLYYTEARVSANVDVAANTLKVSADGSISTHSDVVLTTPAVNEVLTYDGTNWVNSISQSTLNVVATSANYTVTNEDILLVNATAGNVAVTLPNANTYTNKTLIVKCTDDTGNRVNMIPVTGQLIDNLTQEYVNELESTTLLSDGTNWHII